MELAHRFEQLGLSKAKALETANNKKLSANLDSVISAVKSIDAAKGTFLYYLASNITKNSLPNMVYIAQAIDSRKLTSNDQIAAAIRYCDSTNSVIESDFDKASGVGVVFTAQQIYDGVAILLASKASELQGKRYTLYGALLASLKTSLRWAHPGSVKQELDRQLLELLGPKDERDAPKLKVNLV